LFEQLAKTARIQTATAAFFIPLAMDCRNHTFIRSTGIANHSPVESKSDGFEIKEFGKTLGTEIRNSLRQQ